MNLSTSSTDSTSSSSSAVKSPFRAEIARRRTFGIIAHPDAGKTTLTEKILLYSGCIEEAGAVRGRKTQRSARSDWMKMEQERGISVTATCLCFDYDGYRLNLLDTPGHQDFSEDTYRTLNAVDTAVMVVDAVNGIEPQTIKLFKICAERKIPIITFVNKMDRPGGDPLGVLTEIEDVLGIDAVPLNWPIGSGRDFVGVVDRQSGQAIRFSAVSKGSHEVPFQTAPLASAQDLLPAEVLRQIQGEVELLEGAGVPFDQAKFLAGGQTPVFFGSALTNFGVEQFLHGFVKLAPPPRPRNSNAGIIDPSEEKFTGLVFKIQANLDPRHRDRVAFVRVCSGRFERDMEATISRSRERVRIPRSHQLFARERETVEEAFPGDVIGIVNPGKLRLGDTLCDASFIIQYTGRWEYAPERFVRIRCQDTSKRKQFSRGISQLVEEGAVQILSDEGTSFHEPVLAAVGDLQFDVVKFRLETEYNCETVLERLPYQVGRWIQTDPFDPSQYVFPSGSRVMVDQTGARLLLFSDDWSMDYFLRRYPDFQLSEHRPDAPTIDGAQ